MDNIKVINVNKNVYDRIIRLTELGNSIKEWSKIIERPKDLANELGMAENILVECSEFIDKRQGKESLYYMEEELKPMFNRTLNTVKEELSNMKTRFFDSLFTAEIIEKYFNKFEGMKEFAKSY